MSYILKKRVVIEAAHWLPNHPGKCANLHGHSWVVNVEIHCDRLNENGMVVDFGDIKKILERYDHKTLNEVSPFDKTYPPTSENFACVIANRMFDSIRVAGQILKVIVSVKETENSEAVYIQDSTL